MAKPPKNMPEMDFGRMPRRRFMKTWGRLTNRVTKLQLEIERRHDELQAAAAEADGEPPSREARIGAQEQIVTLMDELDSIAEEQERLLRQVVVSVPADWWHPGAPEGMSLDDPECFDWLNDGRFEQLVGMVQSEPKNWLTPTS